MTMSLAFSFLREHYMSRSKGYGSQLVVPAAYMQAVQENDAINSNQ
jgi:hypothetical protein